MCARDSALLLALHWSQSLQWQFLQTSLKYFTHVHAHTQRQALNQWNSTPQIWGGRWKGRGQKTNWLNFISDTVGEGQRERATWCDKVTEADKKRHMVRQRQTVLVGRQTQRKCICNIFWLSIPPVPHTGWLSAHCTYCWVFSQRGTQSSYLLTVPVVSYGWVFPQCGTQGSYLLTVPVVSYGWVFPSVAHRTAICSLYLQYLTAGYSPSVAHRVAICSLYLQYLTAGYSPSVAHRVAICSMYLQYLTLGYSPSVAHRMAICSLYL